MIFDCPICKKPNPLRVLDIHSEEAGRLCLLCELEGVCLDCQKKKHSELWPEN